MCQYLQELAEVLAKYWENVEQTYVGNSKHVFRKLRDERENIYRYFFQIKYVGISFKWEAITSCRSKFETSLFNIFSFFSQEGLSFLPTATWQ